MLSPRHFRLLIFNDIFPQLAYKRMLPTKRGNTTTSSLLLTTSRSRSNFKQLSVNNCVHNKFLKLYNWVDNCSLQQTTTGHQQQRSGQQLSILQLSAGASPTTLDNWQQIDQHQQTTSGGQLFVNNELFMIQHQADSSEQPRDPPTSATTRRESQRSSLEIIAEALNRQQSRRGRRHLSPQPILTPLSTSSVGEMHQCQRSNDNNNDKH